MFVNGEKCSGCEECVEFCPTNAIVMENSKALIVEDLCAECGNCFRPKFCPTDAIVRNKIHWPRTLRNVFSEPIALYKGESGRGTAESKTNDVTNRFKKGEVGFSIDVGRPNAGGTKLREIETICSELYKLDVTYAPDNPVTDFMVDRKHVKLKEDIRNEFVISAIIEFKTPLEKCGEVVRALERVSQSINTVFSVGVISRVDDDETIPAAKFLEREGFQIRPNGKTTLNLGRM